MQFRPSLTIAAAAALACALASCGASVTDGPNPPGQNLVIGGTISGLQGSGLVLQYNGGSDQAVQTGQTAFTFLGISEKSSYAITVKTQPTSPSQVCTVSRGSGSIVYDPIRDVAVDCTTRSFEIRVGVTGLTGTGLSLLLNGGGAVSVAAGSASVSFPSILSGTQYAVTIGTQPAAQTCTINGATGRVGAADVSTVAVACSSPGLTIGGTVLALGANGLSLRLNGGTPLPIGIGATTFAFPTVLQGGADYVVTVASPPTVPLHSCLLARAKGRVGGSNVTDIAVRCFSNGGLDAYTGTFVILLDGKRNYLTLWADGTYSAAFRLDDVACPNNGNGVEYGVYKRATNGTFFIQFALDFTGACGLWNGGSTPGQGGGAEGIMMRTGNALSLAVTGEGTFVFNAVESVPTSLVGAFVRSDGLDGGFIVFEGDGTYMYQEAQQGSGSISTPVGAERGCYTVTGSSLTISLSAACRPDGQPALDQNGTAGFSGSNGASIPFTITSATTVTIGGVQYTRMVPGG